MSDNFVLTDLVFHFYHNLFFFECVQSNHFHFDKLMYLLVWENKRLMLLA